MKTVDQWSLTCSNLCSFYFHSVEEVCQCFTLGNHNNKRSFARWYWNSLLECSINSTDPVYLQSTTKLCRKRRGVGTNGSICRQRAKSEIDSSKDIPRKMRQATYVAPDSEPMPSVRPRAKNRSIEATKFYSDA